MVVVAAAVAEDEEVTWAVAVAATAGVFGRLFLRPPPIGTFRRVPPLVQWRLQDLQKWRGCDLL